jgi:hypothetical protein
MISSLQIFQSKYSTHVSFHKESYQIYKELKSSAFNSEYEQTTRPNSMKPDELFWSHNKVIRVSLLKDCFMKAVRT